MDLDRNLIYQYLIATNKTHKMRFFFFLIAPNKMNIFFLNKKKLTRDNYLTTCSSIYAHIKSISFRHARKKNYLTFSIKNKSYYVIAGQSRTINTSKYLTKCILTIYSIVCVNYNIY